MHVLFFDPEIAQCVARLPIHRSAVKGVAFSPDGRMVATACRDKAAHIWSKDRSGEWVCRASLRGQASDVGDVRFSPDGKQLASASWDNTCCLWDLSRVLK